MRLIFLLLFLPRLGWAADCDLHSFLRSVVYEKHEGAFAKARAFDAKDPILQNPRSEWGKSSAIDDFQKNFVEFNFLHGQKPLMTVMQGSLAEKSPELIRVLDDINRLQMIPSEFEKQFERVHQFKPGKAEYLEFYSSRMDLFKSGVNDFISKVKVLDPKVGQRLHVNFIEHAPNYADLIERMSRNVSTQGVAESAGGVTQVFAGYLTELYASVALPHVSEVAFHLSRMPDISRIIDEKLKRFVSRFHDDRRFLATMEERFPGIFKNPRLRHYRPTTIQERARIIKEWIGSKEIDVVRSAEGKTRWVEIKRNQTQYDMRHFTSRGSKGKSALDQVLEDKEIIEFLGLSDKIQLEYLAVGGLDEEVIQLLKSHGIQVIHAAH
jgi:hypothetical protein